MKILMVASEAVPFAKSGGLADVIGSLPKALSARGAEITVAIPAYASIDRKKFNLRPIIENLPVPESHGKISKADILSFPLGGVNFLFIGNQAYFSRDNLYQDARGDYPDNLERFAFFCRGTLEAVKYLKLQPEIAHAHDWQAGLLPIYIQTFYKDEPIFSGTHTVFTIHNLGYQGLFPKEKFPMTGLSWDLFTPKGLEFYGKVNILKAGLIYSDILTTVSPTYAREIQEETFGFGLHGVLQERRDRLYGILNGLDYEGWDPFRDRDIHQNFNLGTITRKKENKKDLQKVFGLPRNEDIPILGMVTRLADQKGLDILIETMPRIMRMNLQLVILGTGDQKYHRLLGKIVSKYPNKTAVALKYDNVLARKIYAGCDIFLMPSRYEPCGLGQLISLRYGAIPLVYSTGGLSDTISEFDPETGKGNGFSFRQYTAEEFYKTIRRAISTYRRKKLWSRLAANAMECDFSWDASAREYMKLYNTLLLRR